MLRCLEAEFQYFEEAMVVTSSEAKKNLCFWTRPTIALFTFFHMVKTYLKVKCSD